MSNQYISSNCLGRPLGASLAKGRLVHACTRRLAFLNQSGNLMNRALYDDNTEMLHRGNKDPQTLVYPYKLDQKALLLLLSLMGRFGEAARAQVDFKYS